MFLGISQNPQENTCARASFLIKLQALAQVFCEISKNNFSYRTPLVAASTTINVITLYQSKYFFQYEQNIHYWLQFRLDVSNFNKYEYSDRVIPTHL